MFTDLMKRPGCLEILFCSKDAIFCRANSERKIPDRLRPACPLCNIRMYLQPPPKCQLTKIQKDIEVTILASGGERRVLLN